MAEPEFYSRLKDAVASVVSGARGFSDRFSSRFLHGGGDDVRVRPVSGSQGEVRPFVEYELDSLTPEWTLDGEASEDRQYQFNVVCFGRHYDQASGVAQSVLDAFEGIEDADVRAMFLTGQRGTSDADGYAYELTWTVWFMPLPEPVECRGFTDRFSSRFLHCPA